MKLFKNRLLQMAVIALLLPGCASQQDQFGHVVRVNNLAAAQQHYSAGLARLAIQESNGKWSVPIQYAIVNQNKAMATFLVHNGCHKRLGGQNLTYYAAKTGYFDMAEHFVSLGEGSRGDISRAVQDKQTSRRRSEAGALIALGFLAVLMSGSSSSSYDADRPSHLNGRTVQEAAVELHYARVPGF